MPKNAARIAQENGIGNVWGLPEEPLISTSYREVLSPDDVSS